MKVIISRKGFDSGYGGCPSPIFSDGSMFSLPIPSEGDSRCFNEVNYDQHNIGNVVESLTKGRISQSALMHFDPDLSYSAVSRLPDWRPSLGQVGAALTHLHNQKINVGDLFLFYGWFRGAEVKEDGRYQYISESMNQHVIFGWLQIGEILDVGIDGAAALEKYPWLEKHPHVIGEGRKINKIFIAKENLDLPSVKLEHNYSGGGIFDKISLSRTLTKPGQGNRSIWALPKYFSPESKLATLTYNVNPDKWNLMDDLQTVLLDSAKIGQEFVLTINDEKLLMDWLSDVFIS